MPTNGLHENQYAHYQASNPPDGVAGSFANPAYAGALPYKTSPKYNNVEDNPPPYNIHAPPDNLTYDNSGMVSTSADHDHVNGSLSPIHRSLPSYEKSVLRSGGATMQET